MVTLISVLVMMFITVIVRAVRRSTRQAVYYSQYTVFTVRDNVLKRVYTWRK